MAGNIADSTCAERGCHRTRQFPARYCEQHRAQARRSPKVRAHALFEAQAMAAMERERTERRTREAAEAEGWSINRDNYFYRTNFVTREQIEDKYPTVRAGNYMGIERSTEPEFKPRFLGIIGTGLDEPVQAKPAAQPIQIVGLKRQYFED